MWDSIRIMKRVSDYTLEGTSFRTTQSTTSRDSLFRSGDIETYASLLKKEEIHLACIGIGENGHIAFNDPVADFNDRKQSRLFNSIESAENNKSARDGSRVSQRHRKQLPH